jgi:YD repeat-containing protein
MKPCLLALAFFMTATTQAQYYYKDIVGTREASELVKVYTANKVSKVLLASYDAENTRSEDFYVEQQFNPVTRTLRTISRSGASNQSILTSVADASGNVVQTSDSSDMIISTTVYNYNDAGLLLSIISTSADTGRVSVTTEEHLWQYNNNRIASMLRIKNKTDTTYVQFALDAQGNVIEEKATRRGIRSETVHYYYDDQNRLSDVVRYNALAGRLMPEYMFSYSDNNQLIQKITIPSTNSQYLIWRYQYNAQGLKTREAIYDKQKQLTGKIEYQYSFRS